jgi:hypothetical protein
MTRIGVRARHRLIDLDPDLLARLPASRAVAARDELSAPVVELAAGRWSPPALGSGQLGYLVADGVLAREVVAGDTVSPELLGQGDVIRPCAAETAPLLPLEVRWNVLADAQVATLDAELAARLAPYPEVGEAVIERLEMRAQRLATVQAIGRLGRVEARLEALLWHLADRWGRVTREGVVVPLRLSHRLLAELVGARRPTVSVALGALSTAGKVSRRADATWLLTGSPVLTKPSGSQTTPRRRLFAADEGVAPAPRVAGPVVAERLQADLERLREQTAEQAQALHDSCATSAEICSTVRQRRQLARTPG